MKKFSLIFVAILSLALASATPTDQMKTAPQKTTLKPASTIWVTRPEADLTWFAGSGTHNRVEWKKSGAFEVADVHIHLCDEPGNLIIGRLASSTPNDGSENVELPMNQAEGKYTIRVETTDGKVKGTSKPFFIKTSPFILIVPAGDLVRGRTYSIGWRTTQPSSLRIDILLRREGAMLAETLLASRVPNSGKADLRIPPGIAPGTYRFEIQPGESFGGMFFLSSPVRIVS
ncbi:MAG: hypothetical protein FJY79_03360 [Candidatus Aminicenantes bacterium]|nr:hypothetical protein [Candidatus Aminicenantes bacterium]